MAPATTSPIKILSDLGYEVWEIESDADMLRALVEAINSLSITNPKDGRIPILQNAVKEIRGASRAASPSKAQKFTEKRTTLKGSNFIPRAKPASTPKANPVALLSPTQSTQEDNTPIFSTLLNGLKNIASLLKNIALLLGIQFRFKRLLSARQRRADALEAKRKREEGLEDSEKSGIKSGILSSIAKPVKSLWANLLNFFKNIIFGSAVLGFYKWMKDPKNLETIKGIADWFGNHGKKVLVGVITLLGLGLGYKFYRIFRRIGQLVNFLRRLGRFGRRGGSGGMSPTTKVGGELARGMEDAAERAARESAEQFNRSINQKLITRSTQSISSQVSNTKVTGAVEETVDQTVKKINKKLTKVGERTVTVQGSLPNTSIPDRSSLVSTSGDRKKIRRKRNYQNLKKIESNTKITGSTSRPTLTTGTNKIAKDFFGASNIKASKVTTGAAQDISGIAARLNLPEKTLRGVDEFSEEAFKKGAKRTMGIGEDLVTKAGTKAVTKASATKLASRALPFIGTALDAASAYEEFTRGNYLAGSLFVGGAITSLIPGLQGLSLALSIGAIGSSIVEDNVGPQSAGSSGILGPMPKVKSSNITPSLKKKRNVNVVLAPTDTGDGSTTSGSGATNSDVQAVASFDINNSQIFQNPPEYNLIGAYS